MAYIELVIKIPDAPIQDYQDLLYKIHGMAASEGLFDDKEKSQRALALKAVLDILGGIVNGIPLPKGHGRIMDEKDILDTEKHDGGWYDLTDMPEYIAGVKAIIEADKG